MPRGSTPRLYCPFCECSLRNLLSVQRHLGRGFNTSRCPEKVRWINKVSCPGGAPGCKIPARLLVTGYHCPDWCYERYLEYCDLQRTFPQLGPFRSVAITHAARSGTYFGPPESTSGSDTEGDPEANQPPPRARA